MPRSPSLFDPVPLRSASPPLQTPQSTWPAVQQEGRRRWRLWRTETPNRGWWWSCPVRRKLDLSVGYSPEETGCHLQKKKEELLCKFAVSSSWIMIFFISYYAGFSVWDITVRIINKQKKELIIKSRLAICRWSLGRKGQSEMTDCAEKRKYLDMSVKRKMHTQ